MKPKHALLLTIILVLLLCTVCGVWLHRERQQYARNRALIDALTHNDAITALALVNAGADSNTRLEPMSPPTLPQLVKQLLHHTPPPANDTPTAFMMACGTFWPTGTPEASHWITLDENPLLIQAMLAHGANVNATESVKRTALHNAVVYDRLHTVELLLQHGADVNAQDEWGTPPLSMTAVNTTPKVARLLLSHGADVNAQDATGNTVLHYALLASKDKSFLTELLVHGANPNLPDKKGDTPLELAHAMKRPDLVRLMERRGG